VCTVSPRSLPHCLLCFLYSAALFELNILFGKWISRSTRHIEPGSDWLHGRSRCSVPSVCFHVKTFSDVCTAMMCPYTPLFVLLLLLFHHPFAALGGTSSVSGGGPVFGLPVTPVCSSLWCIHWSVLPVLVIGPNNPLWRR